MKKLVTKWIICHKSVPYNEWVKYIALDKEFDTEEQAVLALDKEVKRLPESAESKYFIVQIKRFE